jgi:hypothetical protein
MRAIKLFGMSAMLVGLLAGVAGAQPYPPSGGCSLAVSSSAVAPASAVTVSTGNCATAYAPGALVTLTFASDPVTLGTVTADANGHISAQVTIPSNATAGTHTISATGLGADGSTLVLSTSVTVTAPGAAASRPLAFTGSSGTFPAIWMALAALALGTTMVVGARRRVTARNRQAPSH